MSATNSTTNYSLPLFVPTDKPAWLVDWNGAMSAIDTAIKQAQTAADSAGTDIGSLQSDIVTINATLSTVNSAVNQLRLDTNANTGAINTIQELIGNGTPTTTDKTIIGAINELNADFDNVPVFDFGKSKDVTVVATASGASIPSSRPARVKTFSNSDHTLGKIYGSVYVQFSSAAIPARTPLVRLTVPDLDTTEAYDIEGFYGYLFQANGNVPVALNMHFNVGNTVDIHTFSENIGTTDTGMTFIIPPCLLVFKDLGDGE